MHTDATSFWKIKMNHQHQPLNQCENFNVHLYSVGRLTQELMDCQTAMLSMSLAKMFCWIDAFDLLLNPLSRLLSRVFVMDHIIQWKNDMYDLTHLWSIEFVLCLFGQFQAKWQCLFQSRTNSSGFSFSDVSLPFLFSSWSHQPSANSQWLHRDCCTSMTYESLFRNV